MPLSLTGIYLYLRLPSRRATEGTLKGFLLYRTRRDVNNQLFKVAYLAFRERQQ
jgi:hypothetical protein